MTVEVPTCALGRRLRWRCHSDTSITIMPPASMTPGAPIRRRRRCWNLLLGLPGDPGVVRGRVEEFVESEQPGG